MKSVNKIGPRWSTMLLCAAAMVGCGGEFQSSADEEETEDIDLSFHCNESRGALHRYQMMADSQARIVEGELDTWGLVKLAEERKAPAVVFQHIEGWSKARAAQRDALLAFPPVIQDGRFVEHDTTGIDRQMMQAIGPHHAALKQWVKKECGEI